MAFCMKNASGFTQRCVISVLQTLLGFMRQYHFAIQRKEVKDPSYPAQGNPRVKMYSTEQ